jgi:hypothetical protein
MEMGNQAEIRLDSKTRHPEAVASKLRKSTCSPSCPEVAPIPSCLYTMQVLLVGHQDYQHFTKSETRG